jgi:two-component system LytT family sensor kinase
MVPFYGVRTWPLRWRSQLAAPGNPRAASTADWMRLSAAGYSECVDDNKLILITLLVKLGVAAAVASALARSRTFQRLLFAERRRRSQTAALVAFLLVPLTLGVWVRTTVPNFLAADISFETVILLGLLVGPLWAVLGGVVLAGPAVFHHEYLALPFNMALGLAAGILGRFVEREEVWSFTPFIDLSLYRWVRRNLRKPRVDRQFLMLFIILVLEICREWVAREYPGRLFALNSGVPGLQVVVWLCAPIVVGIALKVWNALRIELKLEEQKRLLLEARLDALQRQINPHFLFNTLNSIASLVRMKPELAREMTVKLANILRALLKDHDTYVPLSEELSFTDDYLDIEVVRFGADKLRVEKEIDPATLGVLVPSILLQPLIENSIKHGLEPRINGGTVTLRSRLNGDRVMIEVADDGVGMGNKPSSALRRDGAGIGMTNVRERLEVLYGNQARFSVVSNPGRGTLISIEIPANLQGSP